MSEQVFLEHLPVIERAISFVCKRHNLRGADADDFASTVKLKIIDEDYAVIRSFQGRSSFSTYITIIINRVYLDDRNRELGRWHSSAEARRIGDVAVELERILYRDGRSLEDATSILGLSRTILEGLAARLPARKPRRRETSVDAIDCEITFPPERVEDALFERDRNAIGRRTTDAMRKALQAIDPEDLLILRLRFEAELSIVQVARTLHLDQTMLYRRIERTLRTLRRSLQKARIRATDMAILLDKPTDLDFGLRKIALRPSTSSEAVAASGKVS